MPAPSVAPPSPRTLADVVRAWDDAALGDLLSARPDLARPAPADVGQMVGRASGRGSVALAVDRLDTTQLTVLEALARLEEEPTGRADLDRIVHARSETVRDVLATLRARALVWGDDEALRLVRTARDVVGPAPAGLGPPVRTLLLALRPARLRDLVVDLGVQPAGDPVRNARLVADLFAEAGTVRRLVDEATAAAGEDVPRLLDRLADGPPSGRLGAVPADVRLGTATGALEHLLARGVLVATDSRTVTLPLEVGLRCRGGHTTRDPVDSAPPVATKDVDAGLADRVGAAAVVEVVRRVELCLEAWAVSPPTVLRSGGVGVRDVRALAGHLGVDADEAGFVVELARAAALLARGDDSERDEVWLPTHAYDDWREATVADRWTVLTRAWLRTPRAMALVGGRDEQGRPVNALAPDLERGAAAAVRVATVDALARLGPGAAPTTDDDVVAQVAWIRPRRVLLRDRTARRTLVEAAWLGITALGALTSAGRAVVSGQAPGPALEQLLPEPVDHVLLQADLTAVAPGPLRPELAHRMAQLADVESRGGATVYRFTSGSVRRALDEGWPAAEVRDFLATHSRTPVPQPLSYLVDDTARRHGRLRVGGAGVYVRGDDPAELDALLADSALTALRLRRLAPTVAVSEAPPDLVLRLLRGAGQAPVLEDALGRSTVGVAPVRRATERVAPVSPVTAAGLATADVAAVVAAVRAGEWAWAARPVLAAGGPPAPTRLVEQLRAAAEDGRTVWLAYLDEAGAVSERVVDPLAVDGGRLTAYDHRSARTRPFALHRISRVAPAR